MLSTGPAGCKIKVGGATTFAAAVYAGTFLRASGLA
jgi:hypothetical protein